MDIGVISMRSRRETAISTNNLLQDITPEYLYQLLERKQALGHACILIQIYNGRCDTWKFCRIKHPSIPSFGPSFDNCILGDYGF